MVEDVVKDSVKTIQKETASRSLTASQTLRNGALHVLSGTRTGKMYKKPDTKALYQASAPGEAPAARNFTEFRQSWKASNVKVLCQGNSYTISAGTESDLKVGNHLLGELLENGTQNMAPRPYQEAVIKYAEPKIKALFDKPYTL